MTFTDEDWAEMERFLGDPQWGPDAEDCERFTSRYGRALVDVAKGAALRSPSASGVGGLVEALERIVAARDLLGNAAADLAESALSAYRAQETQEEGAYHVAGEAYQVIGALAHVTNTFDTPEVQRALDYFSADEQDGSILPYTPPTPAPPSIEELVGVFDDARCAITTLCARYGYEDDGITPKDWSEWQEARRVREVLAAVLERLQQGGVG